MNAVDRTFGWLLLISSLLHAYAAVVTYRSKPETLVWALSATLAGLLLAGLNLLRLGRPGDRSLAWISFWGCIGLLAIVVGFGVSIGDVMDLRVVALVLITLVLASFSILGAIGAPARA